MDDRQFDRLTRAFAGAVSRRAAVKALLGLGGATLFSSSAVSTSEAARRPAVTPTVVPKCPGQQTWNGSACVCPAGHAICGPDCCPDGLAACCDSACCYGTCYGEELCCPSGQIVCNGVCLAPGVCCTNADCGLNQVCVDGSCLGACIPDGEEGCTVDGDCCSTICQSGRCAATVSGTCTEAIDICAGDAPTCGSGCRCALTDDGGIYCIGNQTCAGSCEQCPEGTVCDINQSCCAPAVACLFPCGPAGGVFPQ
jgi:hypothetical protein